MAEPSITVTSTHPDGVTEEHFTDGTAAMDSFERHYLAGRPVTLLVEMTSTSGMYMRAKAATRGPEAGNGGA